MRVLSCNLESSWLRAAAMPGSCQGKEWDGESLVGALVPGGVSAGRWGPCVKPAGAGVPGRVLLPRACKDGCPLSLLGSWDSHGIGGDSGCPLRPVRHPDPWETQAVGWSSAALSSVAVSVDHNELMEGNTIFRAPSLIRVRVPAPGCVNRPSRRAFSWSESGAGDLFATLSCICSAGEHLPGWLEELVPLHPHPAGPAPPVHPSSLAVSCG